MVYRENWGGVAIIVVVVSFSMIYWCWKHYCRKEQEDAQIVSSSRSSPETEHPAASYSPYSRRSSRIGIHNSNGHVAPYRPYPASSEAPNPPTSTPYPLSDTMPQPTVTSTHRAAPYPLPNSSSVPSSADLPPSYAEVMRNS